jgi:hypothetical protein
MVLSKHIQSKGIGDICHRLPLPVARREAEHSCRYARLDARPPLVLLTLSQQAAPSSSIDISYSVRPRHPSRAYTPGRRQPSSK